MVGHLINTMLRHFGIELRYQETDEYLISKGRYGWLQNHGINTVFDIGANTGQFATLVNKIIPTASIYSFEPLKDCYNELQKLQYRIRNIQCFNFGLGEKNESAIINRSQFSPSSSLLPMGDLHKSAFPHTAITVPEQIVIKTLDSISDQISWNKKVLMKIDVQGFEMNVLRGAAVTLSKIDVIIVETSFKQLYKDQPLFSEVYKFLTNKGFVYSGNFDVIVHPKTGEYLQADAIFNRENKL